MSKKARDTAAAAKTAGIGPKTTGGGRQVLLRRVRLVEDSNAAWVEVTVGGDTDSGETLFRVFNPPQLVSDPAGDVTVGGRRYRNDPVAALVEAIAAHGGAVRPRKRATT